MFESIYLQTVFVNYSSTNRQDTSLWRVYTSEPSRWCEFVRTAKTKEYLHAILPSWSRSFGNPSLVVGCSVDQRAEVAHKMTCGKHQSVRHLFKTRHRLRTRWTGSSFLSSFRDSSVFVYLHRVSFLCRSPHRTDSWRILTMLPCAYMFFSFCLSFCVSFFFLVLLGVQCSFSQLMNLAWIRIYAAMYFVCITAQTFDWLWVMRGREYTKANGDRLLPWFLPFLCRGFHFRRYESCFKRFYSLAS